MKMFDFDFVWGVKGERSSSGVEHTLGFIPLCLCHLSPLCFFRPPPASLPHLCCVSPASPPLSSLLPASFPSILSPLVPPLLLFLCIYSSSLLSLPPSSPSLPFLSLFKDLI